MIEKHELHEMQFNDDMKNYHSSKDLQYFDSNHEEQKSKFDDAYTNISCRSCKINFSSNNAPHNYLRTECIF